MAGTTNDYHVTETVLMPLERLVPGVLRRPPLPVAQVYPTRNLRADGGINAKAKALKSTARGLKMFGRPARKPENDVFLQRLARLA